MSTSCVTYIGKRFVKGAKDKTAKVQFCFLEDGRTVWWSSLKTSNMWGIQIGATYEVEDHFPRDWQDVKVDMCDAEECLKYQTEDRATTALQQAKKVPQSATLDKTVQRLRDARYRLSAAQRPAFDAWLLGELRK